MSRFVQNKTWCAYDDHTIRTQSITEKLQNTLFVVEMRDSFASGLTDFTALVPQDLPRRSVTLSWGSGASCVVWIKRARMSHTEDAAARRQSGSTSQPAHTQWVCGGDSGCTRPGLCDTEPRVGYIIRALGYCLRHSWRSRRGRCVLREVGRWADSQTMKLTIAHLRSFTKGLAGLDSRIWLWGWIN